MNDDRIQGGPPLKPSQHPAHLPAPSPPGTAESLGGWGQRIVPKNTRPSPRVITPPSRMVAPTLRPRLEKKTLTPFAKRLVNAMQQLNIPIENTGKYLDDIIKLIKEAPAEITRPIELVGLLEHQFEINGDDTLRSFFKANTMCAEDCIQLMLELNRVIQHSQFKRMLGSAILTELVDADDESMDQQRIESVIQWNDANEITSIGELFERSVGLFA